MKLSMLTRRVLDLMSQIEDDHGLMFHEIDRDLEMRIFETLDSKNLVDIRALIIELDSMLTQVEEVA